MEVESAGKADVDLSKVRSFEKRQELYNILHSEDPDHYSRLWMVGFLKYVGYTADQICNIIHDEACWSNYDRHMTWCQVRSVFGFHRIPRKSSGTGDPGTGCSLMLDKKTLKPLARCNSDNPCSDSIDGFCYISSGEYHLPSVDEKTRRALECSMNNQIARFQRQQLREKLLRELF